MMKQKLLSMLALLLVAATSAWAQSTYTVQFKANGNTVTKEGVTLPCQLYADGSGEGELEKIISELYGVGWNMLDPTEPSSVSGSENVTAGTDYIAISAPFEGVATVEGIYVDEDWTQYSYSLEISIPGYTAPINYSITLADGTVDAANWTVSPNPATAGQTVTIKYTGTKHVKSVKAVKKAAAVTAYTLAESTVGMIVGTDGKAYAVADKDKLPSGVTAAGMVAYKNGSNGLVIALADEANKMEWSTANGATGAAAHTPVISGYSWKLPSQDEWKQMFGANGGNQGSYTGLNTALATAGGDSSKLQEGFGNDYWSSTPGYYDEDCACGVLLLGGDAMWGTNNSGTNLCCIRACLAF